jgi:hypothetical protein
VALPVLGKGIDVLVGHARRHNDTSFRGSRYFSSVITVTGAEG